MSVAESLLRELGISRPQDLDLDVIAWHTGLRVDRKPLTGCDARIVGAGDKGVLTVSTRQSPERQRFSIAHELGHWHLHRGLLMLCRGDEIEASTSSAKGFEREADAFAASLLMPHNLFVSAAQALTSREPWVQVQELARQFGTSLTATALRMIALDTWQGWLVCSSGGQRRWFRTSPSLAQDWFPKSEIDDRSPAFTMHFDITAPNPRPRRLSGTVWFDSPEARRTEVFEHSRRFNSSDVLTLIRTA